LNNLSLNPGLLEKISSYHSNNQDNIRRAYIQKGPYRLVPHNLPQTEISGSMRRFNPNWFIEHKNWLEYNIEKDAAFCLCCYLFRQDVGKQAGGDTFVRTGFKLWHRKDKLQTHVEDS
jgi:hypothetical protein